MARGFVLLLGGTVLLWMLSTGPLLLVVGPAGLAISALAGVVCFLPTAVTWAVAQHSLDRSVRWQMIALFGGLGLRMITALAAGVVVLAFTMWRNQTRVVFVLLLAVYYLGGLATETTMLYGQRKSRGADKRSG
ncbi:MAG: hypothetical protein HY000_34385 [Planctomycetes bacterium]|nr:hypothetical protein [Planctomycetota bacterium]